MLFDKYLCPRCFESQNLSDVLYKCTNTSNKRPCSRAGRDPFLPSVRGKKPKCDECGQPLISKFCPKCGFELPLGVGTTKNYPIAIVGAKESGKSNYVAVLINQLKNEIGKSFECALMACGDHTMNRYKSEFYDPLYRHRTCVGATDSGDVEPLIYSLLFQRPGGFFKKATNEAVALTFFDTAGENLKSMASMQTHNRYLSYSTGIILLLDPLQLPEVRAELEGKIRLPQENTDVISILTRIIEIVRAGTGNLDPTKKIDIPLAISFTKIDAVDSMIDPASCLKNDSSHIRRGYFDMNDFNDSNDEMQSLVGKWLGDELSNLVERNFTSYGFFGLSALGSNPDIDFKIPKFRPFRVADPFLWVLAQKGIIPTK